MKHGKKIKFGMILFFFIMQFSNIYFSYNEIVSEIKTHAMTISESLAYGIDISKFNNLVTSRVRDEYFYHMQNIFKDVLSDSGAKYIYIERKINDNTAEYVFDGGEDCFGFEETISYAYAYEQKESFIMESTTTWGTLITAYTPILDENDNVIALLGVDFESDIMSILSSDDIMNMVVVSIQMMLFLIVIVILFERTNKNKEKRLMEFNRSVVNCLAMSLSKKSDHTWRHSERVAVIAEAIAKKFYKDEKTISTIRWASLLHDVGKIGIPEEILDKPGKLTKEEFDEIKKHPEYSKEILENAFSKDKNILDDSDLVIISDIAKYHHEKWDGSGYPYGLKGEEIPLMARIVSVSDAFEAMTAERPYKKPMDKHLAYQQLELNAGTQFDCNVVKAFKDIYSSLEV